MQTLFGSRTTAPRGDGLLLAHCAVLDGGRSLAEATLQREVGERLAALLLFALRAS